MKAHVVAGRRGRPRRPRHRAGRRGGQPHADDQALHVARVRDELTDLHARVLVVAVERASLRAGVRGLNRAAQIRRRHAVRGHPRGRRPDEDLAWAATDDVGHAGVVDALEPRHELVRHAPQREVVARSLVSVNVTIGTSSTSIGFTTEPAAPVRSVCILVELPDQLHVARLERLPHEEAHGHGPSRHRPRDAGRPGPGTACARAWTRAARRPGRMSRKRHHHVGRGDDDWGLFFARCHHQCDGAGGQRRG